MQAGHVQFLTISLTTKNYQTLLSSCTLRPPPPAGGKRSAAWCYSACGCSAAAAPTVAAASLSHSYRLHPAVVAAANANCSDLLDRPPPPPPDRLPSCPRLPRQPRRRVVAVALATPLSLRSASGHTPAQHCCHAAGVTAPHSNSAEAALWPADGGCGRPAEQRC